MDPQVGRFLQEDPIGILGGDLNFYSYAFSNPINRIDPNGRDSYVITQFGHELLVVDDPNNPGSMLVFDFIPTSGDLRSIVTAVPGTVRERSFGPGELPFGSFEVPFSRRKQNTTQDIFTINRARALQRAAANGSLEYRVLFSDLNCIGFVVGTRAETQ